MKKILKRAVSVLTLMTIVFTMIPAGISVSASDTVIQIENAQELGTNKDLTIGKGYKINAVDYWCMIHKSGNYRAVYCIEPGAHVLTGDNYSKDAADEYLNKVKNDTLNADEIKIVLGEVFLYAYTGKLDSVEAYNRYVATQLLVWETIVGQRDLNFKNIDNGYTPVKNIFSCFNDDYAGKAVKGYYDEYEGLIKAHSKSPSFAYKLKTMAQAKAASAESDGTYTFNDKNNLLSNFDADIQNGSILKKSNNTLKIKADDGKIATVKLVQNNVNESGELTGFLTLTCDSKQTLAELKADPRKYYVSVKGLENGKLEIIKTSEDGKVSGIEFIVTGNGKTYTVKTDKNGKINIPDLKAGRYTITESVPVRYADKKSVTVNVQAGKTTSVAFDNILKKFNVKIVKKDSEKSSAQGNGTLAGAVYGIYDNGKLVDKYTTNAEGEFTTRYYVCGDNWTIKEISPSEGYLLDTTVYKVGGEAKNFKIENNSISSNVIEKVIKGKIELIKHTDDGSTQIETPETGAEFQVFLKSAGSYENAKDSERDTLVCDDNGFAQSKDLPYGIYTIHQTKGWDGREHIADFDIYINENGKVYKYIINNSEFASYIKIVKTDSETGKIIPYSGAGFQIYDPDGNLITMKYTYPEVTETDTFYTNNEGYLITPEKLKYGKGYSLVEVQAPYGYVLNSEPIYFDVIQEQSGEENEISIIKVERPNTAQKGKFSIQKIGDIFARVNRSSSAYTDGKGILIENPTTYTPVFETGNLAGAVFQVIAAEDIVTLDGTVRANAGDIAAEIITDENGYAETELLYLGKYEVKEIKAPDGYVLNTESEFIELSYAGQEIEVRDTVNTEFINNYQRVEISLEKWFEQDEAFEIGNNEEYRNVRFGLFSDEEITAANGTKIPANALIYEICLDESMKGVCSEKLPFAKYYVQEIASDEHYIISDKKYSIEFSYEGQDTDAVKIKINNGEAIENKLKRGKINGIKKDEDGNGLAGALIGLFDTDCKEFNKDNAIITAVSDDNGSFSFDSVPFGNWILREIKSPIGYVLSDESHLVTIENDKDIEEIEIENKKIRGNLILTKVDRDYPDNKLTGAVFEVYKDTDENKEFSENDILIGEMTENEIGIYSMKNLIYGGYFVKEKKAPDGFILDENSYYVFIKDNDKTYNVENKAGIGFINAPQTGILKIVKTSSDGKLEGFSFKVTGENYDRTFKTDKNGEIVIENLRIGKYEISEVADGISAGYILPEKQTAEIKYNETSVIKMHNELNDTPKTGDERNIPLWAALMGISLIGIAALSIIKIKKKKGGTEE